MQVSDRFYVYIDSKKRLSGTDSSFKYEIKYPQGVKFKYVCVLRIAIPKTYYLINKPHNYFILRENGVDTRIEVPIGNIGRSLFVRHVIDYLNTNSPNNWVYNITYSGMDDFDDGKFGYTVTGMGEDDSSSIIFHEGLHEQFGFERNSTNTFGSDGFMESDNVVKFQAEDTLFIHSDLITNSKRSILQDIYVANTPPFSNIIWECTDMHCNSKEMKGNNEGPSFSLTDENALPISLNGRNMCITLLFYNDHRPLAASNENHLT